MSGNEFPMETPDIWGQLKRAREARGLSLGEVSAYLKLTTRQLEAIERGDLSSLPGAAFARGFVRNYARFLGLDAGQFLQAIEISPPDGAGGLAKQMDARGLGDMPQGRKARLPFMPIVLVVLGLLAFLSAGAYFGWFEARDEWLLARLPVATGESSSVPAVDVSSPAPGQSVVAQSQPLLQSPPVEAAAAGASLPVSGAAIASPASAPVSASAPVLAQSAPSAVQSEAASSLVLSFEDDSWVTVRSGDKEVMKKLNLKGSSESLQAAPPLTLVIGNASKVKLSWRGKPVELAPHANKSDVARLSLQ